MAFSGVCAVNWAIARDKSSGRSTVSTVDCRGLQQNRHSRVTCVILLYVALILTICAADLSIIGRVPDSGSIMLEFLPLDVREGLEAARRRDQKKRSRLRVQVGEAVFPVLRFWDEGFALDAALTPHLRGLVDVYDGARHIFQCLIIASSHENGELVCDFKRSTMVSDRAPLDFWRDENAPVALLPKA
jgi:hypothetical protein